MKNVCTKALKEMQMLEYMHLVKQCARRMASRLPANIEEDDLISAGLVGLMQALERFNAAKGHKFKTFAEFRIRGAMLDELRSQDWAPKGMRQKAKKFHRICEKLEAKKGSRATDSEICAELQLNKKTYLQLVQNVNTLEQMNLASYNNQSDDDKRTTIELVPCSEESSNPFEETSKRDLRLLLEKAMHVLSHNEQQVLVLYYFEELNLKEIGEKLSISESRVSQLHSKGIRELKASAGKLHLEIALAA